MTMYPERVQGRPKLVAVSNARDEEENIRGCLNSIRIQSYPVALHVIINDYSVDKTVSIVEKYQEDNPTTNVVIVDSNAGEGEYQHGLRQHIVAQAGMDNATKLIHDWRYLVRIDADIRIPHYYCERLISKMNHDPRIGMVGGRYLSTPSKLEITSDTHVRGSNHIIRRSFYNHCVQFNRNYATPHGEILLERHALIYGWKTRTYPLTAWETRDTGISNPDQYLRGIQAYCLGESLLPSLVLLRKRPRKYLLRLAGYIRAIVRSPPRYFTKKEIHFLQTEYNRLVLSRIKRRVSS